MAIYLKFGEKRLHIDEISKLMHSGNVEAAKCIGNYYAKKRRIDNIYYKLCIDSYLEGAESGCPECIINVSKYSFEYSQLINNKDLKFNYIALSVSYAFKGFQKADTKALRRKALKYISLSSCLIKTNIYLINEYITIH